ncbi:hypothetical protein UFOVP146_32 [uncultured Caudovirales phage]|uniref:Uncharacterized protein n=1 Tax=uncultured Caudovirales phage TaxID=2100421 RepID=A0A6J7VNF7_9CAUD|nr:hypothetical protein UFOVP146_32 [uncultured Caudovirales phage]
MIEQLVSKVFEVRNSTHIRHWATKSFSEHMALGEFYDGVIDHIDSIVEAYQGCFGLIEITELSPKVDKDVIKLLNSQAKWIEENREIISGGVNSIQNLIDGLSDLYLKTIYKLENLS